MFSGFFYVFHINSSQFLVNILRPIRRPKNQNYISGPSKSQFQNWPYRFNASLSSNADGMIREYHFSINGQPIVTTSPVMEYAFHAKGIHTIGLFVTDDLGKNSDTLTKTIYVQ